MRSRWVVWAGLCVAGLCVAGLWAPGWGQAQNAKQESTELIAVLDLEAVSASPAEAQALSDRLREVMLKTGRFKLVERSQIAHVLDEQALQQTGCTSQECAVQVGRILGVRKLIVGKVVKVSDEVWLLSAVLVDVESGETLRAESVRHKGDYFVLMDQRVREIGERMSAPAEVAPVLVATGTDAQRAPEGSTSGLPATGVLTGDQIRLLVSGNALAGAGPKDKWTVRYEPDGTAALQDGNKTDSGRWWVDQDRLCSKWRTLREGKVACGGVQREGGLRFLFLGGKNLRPFDAQHLPRDQSAAKAHRIAVFPGWISGEYAKSGSNGRSNTEWVLRGVRNAVARDNRIEVSFSFYDGLGVPATTHRVTQEATWKGMLFKEVDRDYVRSWAKDLKVDAALVVAVTIPGNGGAVEVQLYDALRDRWYERSGRWEAGKLAPSVRDFVAEVVTEFKERNP